jgi:hypothetical protein
LFFRSTGDEHEKEDAEEEREYFRSMKEFLVLFW